MSYEKIQAIKWELYKNTKKMLDDLPPEHPLRTVPINDLDNENNRTFLRQIEEAFVFSERDTDNNRKWFDSKIKEIIESKERKQVSSNLGELRAYSILKKSHFGENLKCESGKGCDFTTTICVGNKEKKVRIEVNTPLGRDNPKRTTIEHGTTVDGHITTGIKEYAPFGFPEREKDSIGSEVISKINSIKEDEAQFEDEAINILFIDYVNPFLSSLDIMNGHNKPFNFHNDTIYTGNIWWGLYSKKKEDVFFAKAFFYPDREKTYEMEYNGKLACKNSKVDFVILNMYEGISVFEKLFKHKLVVEKEIYLSFMTLSRIDFENLWINYPVHDLKKRVKRTKKQGRKIWKTASFLLTDDWR